MNATLEKGLRVLELLAHKAEPMGLQDIAEEAGANKSTVYRMLETLTAHGYVEQEHKRGGYRAGLKVLELSADILHTMQLRKQAGPFMHELSEHTACDSYLSAADRGRAVIIADYYPEGYRHSDIGSIGHVQSPYITASGKLIAAFSDKKTRNNILDTTELTPKAGAAITDINTLKNEFEEVRTRELAASRYENSDDLYGIAVPVRNHENRVIAALGLAVPREQEEKNGISTYEDMLRNTGKKLSYSIGYNADKLVY